MKLIYKNLKQSRSLYLEISSVCFPNDDDVRQLTNLGTLRAYMGAYLKNNPCIHQRMTLMVRQLESGADGLPMEVYAFTNTTNWDEYEGIQADIFDHFLAILPEFGIRDSGTRGADRT